MWFHGNFLVLAHVEWAQRTWLAGGCIPKIGRWRQACNSRAAPGCHAGGIEVLHTHEPPSLFQPALRGTRACGHCRCTSALWLFFESISEAIPDQRCVHLLQVNGWQWPPIPMRTPLKLRRSSPWLRLKCLPRWLGWSEVHMQRQMTASLCQEDPLPICMVRSKLTDTFPSCLASEPAFLFLPSRCI